MSSSIVSLGKVEDRKKTDNSFPSTVSMAKYLAINLSPSEQYDEATCRATQDRWRNIVDRTGGVAIYAGATQAQQYSPADEETTNYIVFSGKITLMPPVTRYQTVYDWVWNLLYQKNISKCYGRWYAQDRPGDDPSNGNFTSMWPPLDYDELQSQYDHMTSRYEHAFQYLEQQGEDNLSKVPILVCEMKVGDGPDAKYCVEVADGDFRWLTYTDCPVDEDGNVIITFTLGIDPKLNDWLLAKEFDIQNTIRISQNLDVSGTAIPIKASDGLSGPLSFRIISPCYTMWN